LLSIVGGAIVVVVVVVSANVFPDKKVTQLNIRVAKNTQLVCLILLLEISMFSFLSKYELIDFPAPGYGRIRWGGGFFPRFFPGSCYRIPCAFWA
jgi:hypothetical protein